jgi:hypothetical protein
MAIFSPDGLLVLTSALATLVLAVLLIVMDAAKRANRALALLLFFRATTSMVALFVRNSEGRWALVLHDFLPYAIIPVVPAALYFAAVHPRPRTFLGKRAWGSWALLAFTVALEVAYLLDHTLFFTTAAGVSSMGILNAIAPSATFEGLQYTDFGPLILLQALQFPAMAALSIPFALDYLRSAPGSPRFSSFLVAAGFLLNGIFDGTRALFGFLNLPGGAYPWLPWGWAFAILPGLALVPAIIALTMILVHRFRQREQEGRLERRLIVAAVLAAASALVAPLLGMLMPSSFRTDGGFFTGGTGVVLLGLWRLALPLMVSYALFRYALFDIDEKVRKSIQRGTAGVVFAFVYFLVSELIEGVVNTGVGRAMGMGVAAIFTFLMLPIQKMGTWVASRTMPGVKSVNDVRGSEAEAMYRAQFAMIHEDGLVTVKERKLLDALIAASGLDATTAKRIEQDVARLGPSGGHANALTA